MAALIGADFEPLPASAADRIKNGGHDSSQGTVKTAYGRLEPGGRITVEGELHGSPLGEPIEVARRRGAGASTMVMAQRLPKGFSQANRVLEILPAYRIRSSDEPALEQPRPKRPDLRDLVFAGFEIQRVDQSLDQIERLRST